jgi:hypothetical protein
VSHILLSGTSPGVRPYMACTLLQDKKKSRTFYRNNIYSYLFITIQTVFSSIKSPFYYISILKLIYVNFYTILLANVLTIMHLSRCFTLFHLPVNVCLLWVNHRALSLVMKAGGLALYSLIQPTISLEISVPSQGHYGFHSFPVVDWFFLFIYLCVLTFPL